MHNVSSSIAMVCIGGMMSSFSIVTGISPDLLLLPDEQSTIFDAFSGVIFSAVKYVGFLMIAYGLWSLYNASLYPEQDDEPETREQGFADVLKVSSDTIRRYLDRPGIAKDHPLRALPNVLSDLSLLEDGIPAKHRSLVTLTATKIAESVDNDKSWNTEGPRPELSSNIVEKLATLRDDLRREDREQVNQTLSVLSTQLSRL